MNRDIATTNLSYVIFPNFSYPKYQLTSGISKTRCRTRRRPIILADLVLLGEFIITQKFQLSNCYHFPDSVNTKFDHPLIFHLCKYYQFRDIVKTKFVGLSSLNYLYGISRARCHTDLIFLPELLLVKVDDQLNFSFLACRCSEISSLVFSNRGKNS